MSRPRAALLGPPETVAPLLLGARVESDLGGQRVVLRVVEVEAYAGEGEDPASHAHRGPSRRNATMFGEPGHAYVYFTYGMHWCLNVSTGPAGQGAAVLLRAGVVEQGIETARIRRTSRRTGAMPPDPDLARGPARLCVALGVDGRHDGLDLLDSSGPLRLVLPTVPQQVVCSGPRVGVGAAASVPWRFWLPDNPAVSAYRPSGPRRRSGGDVAGEGT
jgi:DNA-3-methyladenine glycosylase